MNKLRLKYMLSSELKRINRQIDMKIARGLSYKRESRHHKTLLSQLNRLHKERAFAFF